MNLSTLKKSVKDIGLLTIALTLALVANFAYGQWTNPTEAPTGGNPALPVNTGNVKQIKLGDFGVTNMLIAGTATATTQVNSPLYCDANGENCWDPATGSPGGGPSDIVHQAGDYGHNQVISVPNGMTTNDCSIVGSLKNHWWPSNQNYFAGIQAFFTETSSTEYTGTCLTKNGGSGVLSSCSYMMMCGAGSGSVIATTLPNCSNGEVITANNGGWECSSPSNGGSTCTMEYQQVSCSGCPAGWTKSGEGSAVSCGAGASQYADPIDFCQRLTCS